MSARKFKGGIHPLEGKELTAGKELRIAPLFDKYIVPVRQNISATLPVRSKDLGVHCAIIESSNQIVPLRGSPVFALQDAQKAELSISASFLYTG